MKLSVDIHRSLPSFQLDVAFDAEQETLGLLGPSGCGKSMTLRCIAGVDTPDEGHIALGDKVLFDSASKVNLPARVRKTALLFQNFQLFPNLDVAKNIAAGIDRSVSSAERAELVNRQVERFQLRGFEHRYPAFLSGGQQQRVALARMLAAKPGMLMLDEPFSALDAHLKSQLEEDLLELFDSFDGPVLYVSHDIDEAVRFCDRISVMDSGRISETDVSQTLVRYPRTLAAAKLTGCENTSAARKVDAYTVEALDWGGMRLTTSNMVPDNVEYLGIRAFYLQPATTQTVNTVNCAVERVSDSRFERTVTLNPQTGAPVKTALRWNVDKLQVPASQLPQKGQDLRLFLDPQNIYLLGR